MNNNTPDFALNGVLRNPLTSDNVLRQAVAEVRRRLDDGTLSDSLKPQLVDALTNVKERLNG